MRVRKKMQAAAAMLFLFFDLDCIPGIKDGKNALQQ